MSKKTFRYFEGNIVWPKTSKKVWIYRGPQINCFRDNRYFSPFQHRIYNFSGRNSAPKYTSLEELGRKVSAPYPSSMKCCIQMLPIASIKYDGAPSCMNQTFNLWFKVFLPQKLRYAGLVKRCGKATSPNNLSPKIPSQIFRLKRCCYLDSRTA